MRFLTLSVLTLIASLSWASDPVVDRASGTVFEINGDKSTKVFTLQGNARMSPGGKLLYETIYLDLSGRVAVTESASFSQERLESFVIRQHQLGELYELSTDDGTLRYV